MDLNNTIKAAKHSDVFSTKLNMQVNYHRLGLFGNSYYILTVWNLVQREY